MVDLTGTEWARSITRTFPLEDISVRPGVLTCDRCGRDATGRLVDAYAAVYDTDTEVHDQHGHYYESIDRTAFNKAIADWSRSKGMGNVSVFYNHGKTLYDTPSEMGSVPLGHPSAMRAESGGLVTSTHYGTVPFSDQILQMIKDGDISGHSFTGRIFRSDPERVPRMTRAGDIPRVRRLVLGLSEYGPTPQPYYETAQVLAVRSIQAPGEHSEEGAVSPAPPSPTETGTEEQQLMHSGRQADIARRIRRAMLARESADAHDQRPPAGHSPAAQ